MLGKVEGSRKRGRPTVRWVDFLKGAISLSLQNRSSAVEDRTFWRAFIHRDAIGLR